LGIAISVREREQRRFRGSNEGAKGSTEGAEGSRESKREHYRAVQERSKWEPEMALSPSSQALIVHGKHLCSSGCGWR